MSSHRHRSHNLTSKQLGFIRHNIDWLAQLDLSDGEQIAFSDIDGFDVRVLDTSRADFSRLATALLEKGPQPSPRSAHVWTVKPGVEAVVEQYAANASLCPCGHAGVRNVRGEDDPGFSCQHDDCEIRFDRETAREVWS